MVAEPRSSDQVDPPSAYSSFSFFSKILTDPSRPYDTDADIGAFNNHLKSLALRSPNKLLEEAKTFLDGSSELLDSEIANFLAPKDKNEVCAAEGKVNLQERRPALGRKRARFSLKPNPSQPAVNLEPSLDIDQLKDPEEFFLAYERLENAKRELQKQMGGVSMDLNQHNPLTTARQRRPGILGRSVRYKHRYSSVVSENNENVASSQETFESDILSPSNHILQQETGETDQNVASQESELADIPEKSVSEILEELLSGNLEDLEGDGAVSLLQKRLQIKPIDLEKLCLPEMQDIQKIDLKSSRGKFPKPRKALSDIDNLLKGISSKTAGKLIQETENSVHHLASPTPPRSPFGPLLLLQRHILQSNPSRDPFSVHDVDHSPARSSSPIECMNKQSDPDDTGKRLSIFDELMSPLTEEDDNAVAKTGSPEVDIGDLTYTPKTIVHDNSVGENFEDLEGDGAVSLLQKRLQIKPIDLEKLCLPEMQDIQKIDLKSSRGKFPKPRKALSDIDNLLKGISSKTPGKLIQETENSVHHLASPTPPRSPFGPLSSLQRLILRSNPSRDPFSVHDVDHSPARSSSPIECMNKQSDLDDTGKRLSIFDELMSPLTEEDDNAVTKTGSPEVDIGDLTYTPKTIVHDNSSKHSVGIDFGLSGTHVDMEDNIGGSSSENMVMDEQSSRHDAETIVHDNSSKHSVGIDFGLSGTHVDTEDNIGGSSSENMVMDEQSSRHDAETIVHDNSSKHSVGIDFGLSGTHVDTEDNIGGSSSENMVMDEQSSRHDAETIVHDNSSKHSVGIDFGLSGTHVDTEDNIGGSSSENMVMDEQSSRHDAETIVHDNSSKHSVGIDVGSSGTHVDMEDKIGGSIRDEMVIDEQSNRHDADMDTRANEPNELEDMVEDMLPEVVASAQPNLNMVDSTGENFNYSQSVLEQSSSSVIEDHSVDGHSKAPENGPEQHIEKIQESTRASPKEQNKAKSRPRKSKELSRKSLAGAGTIWEAGLRRSTRIKTRPLEYWKGEKLLYGRVHKSLTTVIGLKYLSPAKDDGSPTLKVKSYVSDEYKELVELAALH